MSEDYAAKFKEMMGDTLRLKDASPSAMTGFKALHEGTMGDGALDKKTKELIALAIGVNMRCEGCIISHARTAVRMGATLEEIGDAVGVSILMGGGPATVYGGKAIAAAEQFGAE